MSARRPNRFKRHLARNPFLEDFALPMHCDGGGSQMRKSYVALLLLVGAAAALASTALARTDEFGADNTPAKMINAQLNSEMRSAVARPGVAGGNDTVFIGFRPGKVSATNYWGIGKGNFRAWSPNPADYGYLARGN